MLNDFLLRARAYLSPKGKVERQFDRGPFTLRLYQILGYILILASSLTCTVQFFGDPITCHLNSHNPLNRKLFETICWIEGVNTIYHDEDAINSQRMSHKHAYGSMDGVGPSYEEHHEEFSKRKLNFYQFVPLVLLLQGVIALFPYKKWVRDNCKEIKRIALEDVFNNETSLKEPKEMAKLFEENRPLFRTMFVSYLVLLLVCLVMALIQIAFMDLFLNANGLFWKLGWAYFQIVTHELTHVDVKVQNPLTYLFPRRTKCSFMWYGMNGNLRKADGICILTLNNINEKLYLVLWFGLILVILSTFVSFLFHLICHLSTHLRVRILRMRIQQGSNHRRVLSVVPLYGSSEWFVLGLFSNGMFNKEFEDLMVSLSSQYKFKADKDEDPDETLKLCRTEPKRMLSSSSFGIPV